MYEKFKLSFIVWCFFANYSKSKTKEVPPKLQRFVLLLLAILMCFKMAAMEEFSGDPAFPMKWKLFSIYGYLCIRVCVCVCVRVCVCLVYR